MKKPKLSDLTLRQKIAQTMTIMQDLLFDRFDTMEEIKEHLKEYQYGAMWTRRSIVEQAMVRFSDDDEKGMVQYYGELNRDFNSVLDIPLLIGCDCECGANFAFAELSPLPYAAGITATDNPKFAYEAGKCTADEMATTGVNWIWDPVCDLSYYHSPIHNRPFSDDPEVAKVMVVNKLKGIQDSGIAATMKHFPGTGNDFRDPHCAQSVDHSSYERWMSREGAVFQAAIDAGVMSCMVGHTAWPALDDTKVKTGYIPATLSYKIITETLKGKMGFKGVVVTDGIAMRSLRLAYDTPTLYKKLILAGNDIILAPFDFEYLDIIEEAVLSGEIPMERIDDACTRILDMKEKLGLFDENYTGENPPLTPELLEKTSKLNKEIAEKSITLVCDKQHLIPINKEKIKNVAMVYLGYDEYDFGRLSLFKEAFERRGANVKIQRFLDEKEQHDELWSGEALAEENDLILYIPQLPWSSSPFFTGEQWRTTVFTLTYGAEKSAVISIGSPYTYFDYFMAADTYIDMYSLTDENPEAVVAGLYGEIDFVGKPPYNPAPEGRESELI